MSRNFYVTLALTALVAGCTGGSDSSAPKKSTTPKACVESLVVCIQKADIEGAAAYMTPAIGPKMAKMGKGMKAMEVATEKLAKAVDAKFGAGTADSLGMKQPKPEVGTIEIVDVKEAGDKATVKTKETKKDKTTKEDTIQLVKLEGAWYAEPPQSSGMSAEQLAKADAMGDAMVAGAKSTETLADDVASGKVKTKEEVQNKQMEIGMGIMKAMMGGAAADKQQ